MSSKEEGPDRPEGLTGLGGPNGPDGAGRRTRARPGQRELTDPAVMRALSHPLRLSLLEELIHAGTLTATQAGEILGETPANCAFHLRTLARYGLVEEAGGGKGRERPWRRAVTDRCRPLVYLAFRRLRTGFDSDSCHDPLPVSNARTLPRPP